jgi:hypothetical protein
MAFIDTTATKPSISPLSGLPVVALPVLHRCCIRPLLFYCSGNIYKILDLTLFSAPQDGPQTVIWTAVSNEDRRMTTWSWRRARRTGTLGVEAKMEARRCRLDGDGAGAAAAHKTRSMRTAWDLVPIGEPIKPTGKEINWSASPPSSARAMPSYW